MVHPLLKAIDASFGRSVTPEAAAFRAYMLSLVKSEHLSLRAKATPRHAEKAWQWVLSCLRRTGDDVQLAKDCETLLRTCLDYLLVVDEPEHKQQALAVLQVTLQAVTENQNSVDMFVMSTFLSCLK